MDKNITKARAYLYEFLSFPLFFHENDEKFKIWKSQLEYLAQNPLTEEMNQAFKNLQAFDFDAFLKEQNEVLFDLAYSNIPLNASFYEDGRDDGAARLRTIECLKLSPYRRNSEICKDSEDFIGFVFLIMATFLNDEINGAKNISKKLFKEVVNNFADEFASLLQKHKSANFFNSYAKLVEILIQIDRVLLAVEAPIKPEGDSVAVASMKKEPFQSKMPTAKTKLRWEEFTPVIQDEL
ncbi:TorD/DmsD family molecular chaperone [Campylobacter sp. RM16192]|uniref:TorD/DmsD family molecular chaperone n=1 Tax=Campylobacter sp. RM16192 TaxID=1660080 RepID=UPI0014529ED7|nr:formate dehydrogenase-specific chaperone [Campylobacter sp. RM16192]QCD51854.1 putative formate dehydrogenase-specific chaperone [Campylobacter sp. RM16192]